MRIYLQRHTQQLRNLKLQHVIEAQPAEQMETDSRPAPSSSWGEKKRGGGCIGIPSVCCGISGIFKGLGSVWARIEF